MDKYTPEENKRWLASLPRKIVAAKAFIVTTKGNVLLVKPDYKDGWQLPGGGVEASEDPKDALLRELREEIGITFEQTDFRLVDTVLRTDEDSLILIYVNNTLFDEATELHLQDDEIEDSQYATTDQAMQLLARHYQDFVSSYMDSLQ